MLKLSEQAQQVIRTIPSRPALPETAGLRIAAGSAHVLRVRPAAEPQEGDVVAEYDDARVFLDRSAVAALRDRRLDVALGNDGRWHFQCPTRS